MIKMKGNQMNEKKIDILETIQFEEIVTELACNIETMDEDEYSRKYDTLPKAYQQQVDANELSFADDTIGCSSWRSDW